MKVQRRKKNVPTVTPEVFVLSTSPWESSVGGGMIQFGVVNHKGVRKSLGFLWAHYHKPLSVPALSKVAGMSRRGIHQAFMKHLGRPPGRVLRDMRIQRAKELLIQFDYKVRVVAAKSGYRNLNSFEVAFKNATGLSPKQFQRQWRCSSGNGQQNGNIPSTYGIDCLIARNRTMSHEARL